MTARTETTANFDLSTVQLPELTPLQNSFAVDDSEDELKKLFISLFREHLAGAVYDVNVSGAMHLGSYDLVRRAVNADGLVLLESDRAETAVRYLYRAWRARNRNGRGLFFLRTYLQLLYPNLCEVAQLWQAKDKTYPYGLYSTFDYNKDGTPWMPDESKYWLTSRVEMSIGLTLATRSITTLTEIFRSILPARIVPQFRFWHKFDAQENIVIEYVRLYMDKRVQTDYPWGGHRIMHADDYDVWYLAADDDPDTDDVVHIGGTPVNREELIGSKELAIGFPWSDLIIQQDDDSRAWEIGTDEDTDYKFRIRGFYVDFDMKVTKV